MARLTIRSGLFVLALAAGAGIGGCAKEGMPPGGPEDIEAPGLEAVSPVPGATGVSRFEPIVFHFSEAMNHASVEKALFFTPDIGSTLRVNWRGRELRLEPQVRYRENTTIVVTLGADAADTHRNRLGESLTFAFSTGSELDAGVVSGQVVEAGRPASGSWLWIYELAAGPPDPSPLLGLDRAYPLYITQTDDAGYFEQRYMGAGSYRIFAFIDRNSNLRFDLDTDPLAVPPTDIHLSGTSADSAANMFTGLVLNLAPRDTVGPRLRSAVALDSVRITLTFSEPPAPETVPRVAIAGWDEAAEAASSDLPAPVIVAAHRPVEAAGSLLLRVAGAEPGTRYLVRLLEAVDAAGNPAREAVRPVLCTVPARSDTTAPRLAAVTPPDSSRGLNRDTRLRLTFATEVDPPADQTWRLIGPDTLDLTASWLDPRTIEFELSGDPREGDWYRLPVPLARFTSWTGINGPSGLPGPAWQAAALPGRGTLRLSIAGDREPPAGGYVIYFEGAGSRAAERVTVHRAQAGEFATPELPVGPYCVWGFADADADGRLDTGAALPFEPAEIVAVLPDTLYVRDSFESSYALPLVLRAIRPPPEEGEEGR